MLEFKASCPYGFSPNKVSSVHLQKKIVKGVWIEKKLSALDIFCKN